MGPAYPCVTPPETHLMSPTHPLRVITTLPDLTAYQDRVLPLIALSKSSEVSLVYLLTVEGQRLEHLEAHPKLKVIEAPRRGYLRWISRWLLERLEAGAVEVVHDCFGHLALAFERPREGLYPVRLTVQYTTNWGWFQRVRPLGFELSARYAYLRAQSLWLDARVTRASDRVVVLGPGHERDLIEGHGLSPEQITVIPPEVDATRFYPKPALFERPRERRHPPQTGQLIHLLYVGALSRNKGLDLLLGAFSRLAELNPNLRLTLIGRVPPFEASWLQDRLERCEAKGVIEALPALPQTALISHYQRAHLYLFPSRFEGSPRSLREALACGCVCVSADLPGCRGLDPEGDFIHFVPEHSLEAWIQATRDALHEPQSDHRARALRGVEHMRSAHSPQVVADHYLSLYQQLIEARRAQFDPMTQDK